MIEMKDLTATYTLANGVKIPVLGLGTGQAPDSEATIKAVKTAIEIGYRHIDTAQVYENETSIGGAIQQSGVSRKELFVTTKIWNNQHTYDKALASFEESLEKLATDYVNLLLVHWPNPPEFRDHWQQANKETWRGLEALYRAGKARAIGVSNFRQHHLEALLQTAEIKPMVNQMFLAPGELQPAEVAYCQEQQILLEAYSPLGTGRIFQVPEIMALADKYHKTVAQVVLRWSLQHGFLPLPKSITPSRIKENTEVFDFQLSAEDMQIIDSLDGVVGKAEDPDTTDF